MYDTLMTPTCTTLSTWMHVLRVVLRIIDNLSCQTQVMSTNNIIIFILSLIAKHNVHIDNVLFYSNTIHYTNRDKYNSFEYKLQHSSLVATHLT